jgi:hypothetical protein
MRPFGCAGVVDEPARIAATGRVVLWLATLALLLLLVPAVVGCSDDPAGTQDAGSGVTPGCCTLEASEDCSASYQQLGACCYNDKTLQGTISLLVRNCQDQPRCRACCNEYARLSCSQHKALGNCPNQVPK